MNFSLKFGPAVFIWYPASGFRSDSDGSLFGVGSGGSYWSASPNYYGAYSLLFNDACNVYPSDSYSRAFGLSVRCLQE